MPLASHPEFLSHLQAQIQAAGGAIPFDAYMALALYHPRWGYYCAPGSKLGSDGDFITAPEASPLLGQLLGRFYQAHGANEGLALCEAGPGTGALTDACLQYLAARNALPPACHLVEVSPSLTALQQQRLAPWRERVLIDWQPHWPPLGNSLVIANEVLDALPVKRFCRQKDQWREAFVGLDANARLQLRWQTPTEALAERLAQWRLTDFPEGYQSESCLGYRGWLAGLAQALGASRGLVLILDYGYHASEYYHPQRQRGTLTTFCRHQQGDDPLLLPGRQDISAHVDFSALWQQARTLGFSLLGYWHQAQFLLNQGLSELAQSQPAADWPALAAQIKWLTAPGEMGDLVKCLLLGWQQDPRDWPPQAGDRRFHLEESHL